MKTPTPFATCSPSPPVSTAWWSANRRFSQVKQAYQAATDQQGTGPLTHAVFQAAIKVARRIAVETTVHQRVEHSQRGRG